MKLIKSNYLYALALAIVIGLLGYWVHLLSVMIFSDSSESVSDLILRLENENKLHRQVLDYEANKKVDGFEKKILSVNGTKLPSVIGAIGKQTGDDTLLQEAIEDTQNRPSFQVDELLAEINTFKPKLSIVSQLTSFPPEGEQLGQFSAQIFYPMQKMFAPVTVHLIKNDNTFSIYGGAMCEATEADTVILAPCIFYEKILGPEISLVKSLDIALQKLVDLQFIPWGRWAVTYDGCETKANEYRSSIQFGSEESDVFISFRVPVSLSPANALTDLNNAMKTPCAGMDLFFRPLALFDLLKAVYEPEKENANNHNWILKK